MSKRIRGFLIAAAFLVLWIAGHFLLLREWGFSLRESITDAVVSNFINILCCAAVYVNLRYYRPARSRYLYFLLVCAMISAVGAAASRYVLGKFPNSEEYRLLLGRSTGLRFDLLLLLTCCVALISELWHTIQERREQEKREVNAARMAREAELFRLQQQLQPHFLFNSLNSISALVKSEPAQARKMILQLSEFLRGTLRKDEQHYVPLCDELKHLELYLEIEKVRFGHRLNTRIERDETVDDQPIPHMILQPAVENAIKFGLYDTTGEVTIQIQARLTDNYTVVTIKNPFDPETSSPQQGTGFGLHSTQRRLFLLYSRNDLLSTEIDGNIFTTTIKIPAHDKSIDHR